MSFRIAGILDILCIPEYLQFRPIIFHFFFNDSSTTEIYTLSLHDALPICDDETCNQRRTDGALGQALLDMMYRRVRLSNACRSEEHTSELQSRVDLVCRLLLEKKKKISNK